MEIDRKWIIYGGIGALVLVGGYYYLSGSSTAATSSTDVSGASALPDLTFAAPPLGAPSGSDGLAGTGTTGTDALTALMNAFSDHTQQPTVEQLNEQQHVADVGAGVTVFNSLVSYLNAHKGLNHIRAVIPDLGTVQVGPTPTVTKTKTKIITKPPAVLDFSKGSLMAHAASTNKTKITSLLQRGYKAV